jgi:hypothetical protein
MNHQEKRFTAEQLLFKELFVGTLIYVAVLGFFNDYTQFVYAKSFSTLFFAALVLEVLTYLVLLLKKLIVGRFKNHKNTSHKVLMAFLVWLVMFSSKFVFIWAIDFVFGGNITVVGFFGILLLALAATVTHKLADAVFMKLGSTR